MWPQQQPRSSGTLSRKKILSGTDLQHAIEATQSRVNRLKEVAVNLGENARACVPASRPEATQSRVNRLQEVAANLGENARACVPASLPEATQSRVNRLQEVAVNIGENVRARVPSSIPEATQARVNRLHEAAVHIGENARACVPTSIPEATQTRVNRLHEAAVNVGENARARVPASIPEATQVRLQRSISAAANLGQSASRTTAEVKTQLSERGSRMAGPLIKRAQSFRGSLQREGSRDFQREGSFPREPDGQVIMQSSRCQEAARPPGYRASEGTVVSLHVYDALWMATSDSNMPVVHLGVEVYGNEFSFGETGLKSVRPGLYDAKRHRCRLPLGRTHLGKREVYKLVIDLKKEWPGESYQLLGHNCQTFALQFCETLGLSRSSIPSKYVYFAKPGLWSDVVPMVIVHNSGSSSSCRSSARSSRSSNSLNSSTDFDDLELEVSNDLPMETLPTSAPINSAQSKAHTPHEAVKGCSPRK